ncbi:hypothetical protein D3C72_909970 [compost metagenome]
MEIFGRLLADLLLYLLVLIQGRVAYKHEFQIVSLLKPVSEHIQIFQRINNIDPDKSLILGILEQPRNRRTGDAKPCGNILLTVIREIIEPGGLDTQPLLLIFHGSPSLCIILISLL